ncbi:hypothetical protein K0T92_19255 [Paenibacillus oenotherae]|uniref:Uncharacterized protein n=1 Tax=Paenibacillus oenotherae TaxID=1435645 RepID=A0ABS7DCH5_9BACL|nr:hypothetical protein [Paenibacillus oenotherae]MBW7476858.1 hypothetical protein [Paenibacillus oenotherae]
MLDFEFEIIDENTINLRYQYGGEWLTFNLFLREGDWILHPFQGILLQNREMCRLVVTELLQNKTFHMMLAKQHIPLSSVRSSVDLGQPAAPAYDSGDRGDRGDRRRNQPQDEISDFIQEHSLESIVELELELLGRRKALYSEILQRMFMDGVNPSDEEFMAIQNIVRIYSDAMNRLSGDSESSNQDSRRRW